ncbi:MAG: 23S rRNA (guanosine(2251)-2'-O)-methyltransferase RlmB [Bacteroidetes bacterium]|nr:MAG: 23S rRNA (guanosine(2251)-2'-O)-methyltransferase RlmB [Bacteroidota bacterium]
MALKKKDLIFGIRTVIEAIKAGKDFDKIQVQRGTQSTLLKELLAIAKTTGIPVQFLPPEKFRVYSYKNHQGVIAVLSPVTYQKIENILPDIYEKGEDPFILILDEVSDVRNFGAISRTAECAGIHAIVIPDKGSAAINSDAIKASAGALYQIPVCRVHNILSAIDLMKESGLQIVAASEKSDKNYTEAKFTGPLAIVMGSEEKGVSYKILKLCDETVKIPILGSIESLNVSVATGILLYEAVKQKKTEN